jgi:FtsH-binding integral membrane protein
MSKASALYRDSGDFPRPPPTYEPIAGPAGSSEPLLGEERGRHSDDDIPDDFKYGVSVSQSDISIRMGFIRKVYGILFTQLLATTIVSGVFKSVPSVQAWVQGNPWMMWVSLFGTIAVLIGLFIVRKKYPANFWLLGAFTLLEAYTVGTIVTFYDTTIVLEALLITVGLFAGLTLFTLQSKWDFSGMGPFLFGGLWALVLAGFVMLFFPHNGIVEVVYSAIGALIFALYIIYDTYNICNVLHPDEYIVGAINLYLDIINLFLNILRILNSMNSSD